MKIPLVAGCAALLALSSGCGSNTSTVTVEPHPTIIEVNPRDFLGSLKCGTGADDLQRYVVTLRDVTPNGTPPGPLEFELPSSAPARCEQAVAFGLVVAGHFYVAEVDGYDRADLTPLVPGARLQQDASSAEPVAPRWKTECGTTCPYPGEVGCPARPLGVPKELDTLYPFAVRAESEFTQRMDPCWPWSNP